ncbi:MAG: restriction endonuclease subunit S [Campylobacter sp.]|nr:restriction endonuclease subunit S [Campylobacter sp.]
MVIQKKEISKKAQGKSVVHLYNNDLKNIETRIPNDIKEQEKIGEFFRKIDGILDLENSRFKKLENFKKTMLDKLFVKDGADEPQIRLGSFKGKWNSKILGDIADIYQPQTIQAVDFTKNGFDVYGANGIIGKYHSYNHENSQIAVACRGNTCGVVNFTKPKSWITGNAMVINIDNSQEINKYFLYQLLANTDFSYLISGSGQPQITGTIKNHKTRIPSDIKEQEAIGEFFRKIDGILEFSQKKITKLENIKKYLLNKMFV